MIFWILARVKIPSPQWLGGIGRRLVPAANLHIENLRSICEDAPLCFCDSRKALIIFWERIRSVCAFYTAIFVGRAAHFDVKSCAFGQSVEIEEIMCPSASIEPHWLDIQVLIRVVASKDFDFCAVGTCDDCLFEERRAKHILTASGADGVEAQSREHIPCGGLSVIFIAAVTVWCPGI